MADGTLAAIHLHPIKSCGRVEVLSAIVAGHGLQGDRSWQVIDADAKPITQRQHPILATVRPELLEPSSPNSGLRISADNRAPIEVAPITPDTPTIIAKTLFGVAIDAGDAGDEAADWFSDLLGQPVRLVGADPSRWRPLPERFDVFDQPVSFADAGPVLVATTASLDWLVERSSEPFTMPRFRPNLVVDTSRPWVEDTWHEFTIGDAALVQGLPWPRCAIPQIDQDTGARFSEPAKVLRRYRWCTSAPTVREAMRPIVEGNGLFGLACSIGAPGAVLTVGDELTVVSTREPVLAPPA